MSRLALALVVLAACNADDVAAPRSGPVCLRSCQPAFPFGATPRPGGVHFRVWAPAAQAVRVLGPWGAAPLEGDDDGVFAGDVPGARIGDAYQYELTAGGQILLRSDPYARVIEEDHELRAVVVDPGFDWGDETRPALDFSRAAVYELHIPSFTTRPDGQPGTWRTAIDRLDDLAELGVNVLEVMPPFENHGQAGWGYGPKSLFAAEMAYGTPADLKAFVRAAHARGLAVIIDWVPNHLSHGNVLDDFDGTNLYFYPGAAGMTPWGPRPDFDAPGTQRYLEDSLTTWLDEYHFDGARVDSTITVRQHDGHDLPGAWQTMQRWNQLADARGALMIAEDLQANDWLTRPVAQGGAGYDSQWDVELFYALHDAVVAPSDAGRDVGRVARGVGHVPLGRGTSRLNFTESHDTAPSDRQWRMPLAAAPQDPEGERALKLSTLAAAVMLTAPGIPMLLEGQECLTVAGFDFPLPPALDWSRCQRFAGIRALYRDLLRLRRDLDGLGGDDVNVFHVNDAAKVVAWHRWVHGGAGDDVIVVANFSGRTFATYDLGLPSGGTWHVRFNSDSRAYADVFHDTSSADVTAVDQPRHGLAHSGLVALGPYSLVVLSQ